LKPLASRKLFKSLGQSSRHLLFMAVLRIFALAAFLLVAAHADVDETAGVAEVAGVVVETKEAVAESAETVTDT